MNCLLAISVGPVQDFIAAARRTRDLWFGSYLLSEISRSVAVAVQTKGELIFPHPGVIASGGNVANIVVAELNSGEDPASVAATAKAAAADKWASLAKDVFDRSKDLIRREIWQSQVGDVIEFYAAWASRPADYSSRRRRVMALLAGRKNCRDFLPALGWAGVPKSSLDGARESVLLTNISTLAPDHQITLQRLRLTENEQLDCVGLVKRLGGGQKNYPSVVRIAADPWLRGLAARSRENLAQIKQICERLVQSDKGLTRAGWPQFDYFPYDGTAVYRNRYRDMAEQSGTPIEEYRELREAVLAAENRLGVPEPYLAILMADGDRMGATLSSLKTSEKHRDFSRDLSQFAGKAQSTVARHHGSLIYSGGDDVLALVPVDQVVSCARSLRADFDEALANWKTRGALPTLSVGVAIGHFMEALEDLRRFAKEAETHAKGQDRDGFAIHVHPRSGSPVSVRAQWKTGLDADLHLFARLFAQALIPSKVAYDFRLLTTEYAGWSDNSETSAALVPDLFRLLRRKAVLLEEDKIKEALKNGTISQSAAADLQGFRQRLSLVDGREALDHLTASLIVARQISLSLAQAQGRVPENS